MPRTLEPHSKLGVRGQPADDAELAELTLRWLPQIHWTANRYRRRLRNPNGVDDLVAELTFRAVKAIRGGTFDPGVDARTRSGFAYRTAVLWRAARDYVARERKGGFTCVVGDDVDRARVRTDADLNARIQPDDQPLGTALALAPEARDGLALAEAAAVVARAVARLPPEQRDVVRAVYGLDGNGGCHQLELAAELGVSRQAVSQRMERALAQLRFYLDAHNPRAAR